MRKLIFLFCLILVAFLGQRYFAYKTLGIREIPLTTDILDEKNYIWAAKSFLQTGIPTAWSNLDAYGRQVRKDFELDGLSIKYQDEAPSLKNIKKFDYPVVTVKEADVGKGPEQLLIVQPFFDHSFVAGLVYGLKTPNNVNSLSDVQPEQYRLVAAYVALATSLFLFILAYLLYGNWAAIITFIIYSTVSVYLLVSRYALIENLLVPLTLLSLIFLVLSKQEWIKKASQKKILWILAGISAGLALTTKELGLAAIIAGFLILLAYKNSWKESLYFLIPAFVFGSFFYLYALFVSPRLFFDIFINQANRGFFGPLNFIYSFYRPHFAGFPLEGWWVFGFIALLFLVRQFEQHRELIISFLSYLVIFLFFGGLNHPWYSLVFVPFMVISSAVFIKEMLFKPTAIKLIIFFLFPFSSTLYWGYNVFHQYLTNVITYRASIFIFLALMILSVLKKKIPWSGIVVTLILLVILWKVYQWNLYGFTYLIANWGKLNEKSGFF